MNPVECQPLSEVLPIAMFYYIVLGAYLILTGCIVRAAAINAERGWMLASVFFISGIVLGYFVAVALCRIPLFREYAITSFLLNMLTSLVAIVVISLALRKLLTYFDSAF